MRKRRRLANKMTIMVCAVLIAVSAFFYVPMDVSASENVRILEDNTLYPEIMPLSFNESGVIPFERYITYLRGVRDSVDFDFSTYMNGSGLYRFSFDITANYYCSNADTWWRDIYVTMYNDGVDYTKNTYGPSTAGNNYSFTTSMNIYVHSNNPIGVVFYGASPVWLENPSSVDFSFNYSLSNVVVSKVSSEDSEDYQNGYNAGYSAGESAGYGNGYSQGFTDGEASVDTDAIYDEAFQAGKDSVDTQSYYDAGYQAGYQLAYSDGYESGYDSGYQDALDRVANWGADTTNYPKLLTTKTMSKWGNPSEVQAGVVTDVNASLSVDSGIDVNHNHTYRFDISVTDYDVTGSTYIDPPANHDLYFYVGSNEFYLISQNRTSCNQTLYVNGSTMSDVFGFIGKAYNVHVLDTQSTDQLVYTYLCYTVKIYDMGPTGDTQNHIANQTDKLNENADKNTDTMVNGFDNSKGNKVNSDLSSGLDEYQTAEDSLWATATTGMKDFTFFDIESVPAMVTGISFITATMTGWFNQAGGASGVGIVLSILFSVMLVAMVLGLYRWYQSRGGKD